MLIVAERINASRKAIRAALEKQDAAAIVSEVRTQTEAGAHYIDLNGGTFPGREAELLCWLVDTAQGATALPLCLDSPDPDALAAALPRVKGERPMINSINLEPERFARVLPLAREHRAKLIALAQGEGVPAASAAEKLNLASRLVEQLVKGGMILDDIYVDPLTFPIGTGSDVAVSMLDIIEKIMAEFPGVHTIAGISNVSHGMPARKLLNQAMTILALGKGLDAGIVDPNDPYLMALILATEALLGRDDFCMNYISKSREGAFEGI